MPLYDLMLLLDPGAPTERRETIMRDVQEMVASGGNVVVTQEWGERRMAFEIDHRPEADYHLLQFETQPGGALLERIDHSLKIMDGVLRHRIIRLKDGSPPPPMPRPDGRRDYGDAEMPREGGEAPAEAPAEAEGVGAAASSLPPEEGQPADAPAIAGTAPAEQPTAPSDMPAPAPAETPPPPDVHPEDEPDPAGEPEGATGA